jgi:hypothetical protein
VAEVLAGIDQGGAVGILVPAVAFIVLVHVIAAASDNAAPSLVVQCK